MCKNRFFELLVQAFCTMPAATARSNLLTTAALLGRVWMIDLCLALVNFMYWALRRQALRKLFFSTCFVFSAPVSCFSCLSFTWSFLFVHPARYLLLVYYFWWYTIQILKTGVKPSDLHKYHYFKVSTNVSLPPCSHMYVHRNKCMQP